MRKKIAGIFVMTLVLFSAFISTASEMNVEDPKSYPNCVPPFDPIKPIGPSSGKVNQVLTYTTACTPPVWGAVIRVKFYWGDGSTTLTSYKEFDFPFDPVQFSESHQWTEPGTYYIKVRAWDKLLQIWSDFSPIKVVTITNDAPNKPNRPSGPSSGSTGVTYSFSTKATDPNGDDVRYLFNWGDMSRIIWTSYKSSGQTITVTHRYGNPGTYKIKVKAEDVHGKDSDYSLEKTITITKPNSAPNKPSCPSGPNRGKQGQLYTYSSTATDPDGDKIYFFFEWGDGTNSGWQGPYNSGYTLSLQHTWPDTSNDEDTYSIRVKAKDEHGVVGPWSDPKGISMPINVLFNRPILNRISEILRNLLCFFESSI